MNPGRILCMVHRDLRTGPRSSILLWILSIPILITVLMQVVFVSLLDPLPRLGIYDSGDSRVTELAGQMSGLRLTHYDCPDALISSVERNDEDAGLVLQRDFD